MANLKDISTVPELKSLEGTEKVLLNVDGSARQVQVDLIKPKEEWDIEADFKWCFNKENSEWTIESDVKYIADFSVFKEKLMSGLKINSKISYAVQGDDDTQNFTYGYNWLSVYYCPAYVVAADNVSDPEMIVFEITSHNMTLNFALLPDNSLMID